MYLSVEEYIAKRKRQDAINEFDAEQRVRNMGLCISYIVDYFEKYIDPKKLNAEQAIRQKKAEKHQKHFAAHEKEIADWLLSIYIEYGNRLDLAIHSYFKSDLTNMLL